MTVFPNEQFVLEAEKENRSKEYIDECLIYIQKLEGGGYPILFSIVHLAISMGIQSNYIRALSGEAKSDGANVPNFKEKRSIFRNQRYKYFKLKKRSGGYRIISAPHRDLKYIQKWIYFNILSKYKISESCKGFISGLSIKDNAKVHEGASKILKVDLLKFFDTISEERVFGIFAKMGYAKNLSVTLARLCYCTHNKEYWEEYSETDREILSELFENRPDVLPQGAPSSPMIANIVAKRMDERFEKLSIVLGFSYSRYADDLTFSIKGEAELPSLFLIKKIIKEEGFFINPKKVKYIAKGKRQLVTGLSISNGIHVTKRYRKSIMRHIHFCRKYGVEDHLKRQKTFLNNYNVMSFHDWLYGSICFVKSVDDEYSEKLLIEFNKIDWIL